MVFMRFRLPLFLALCAALFSQAPPPARQSPVPLAPDVRNFAFHTVAVISCEKRPPDTAWFLTIRNISDAPLFYITVSGYTGGSQGLGFQDSQNAFATSLAPGATFAIRIGFQPKEPVRILSTVTVDGDTDGDPTESAAALASWLGESIQNQNIVELMKLLTADDSDQAIDGVVERLNTLDTRPPLSIDTRIQALVAAPSVKKDGRVQFRFYTGLDAAKQTAVHRLSQMKQLTGDARHKFAQGIPQVYAAETEWLNRVLNGLSKF
jgi:hypothetical protein